MNEVRAAERNWLVAALITSVSLLLTLGGCPTSSEGIDLTESGELTLVISRDADSTIATAIATVTDNSSLLSSEIVLADDQVLSVNSVPLTATTRTALGLGGAVAATIEADDTYTVSFDNQGVETTLDVTPPEDLDDVTPESSDSVTRDGFEIEWDASDDDDVLVDIDLTGWATYYNEDGALETGSYTVTLSDLADDGDVTIGSSQLAYFLTGDLTVTLRRVRTISQKLGFSSGTIILKASHEIALTLEEPDEDEEE